MDIHFVFSIVILMLSVIVHEVSHGYAALWLGDPTARLQGRLTLNPLKHLEWFGSVILPTLSYMLGGFIFGWAKPVMINPYNLRAGRWGEAIVAFAGPLSNFFIAFVFGRLIHFAPLLQLPQSFVDISLSIVIVNLVLGVFNLIPIPPLDGSKLLFAVLPAHLQEIRSWLDRYGFFVVIILLSFISEIVSPVVGFFVKIFL